MERDTGIILVDDLDTQFEVDNGSSGSGLRVKGTTLNIDTDQGLPVRIQGQGLPSEWNREVTPEAFGKYRHTFAMVKVGSGSRKAIFTAEIPTAKIFRPEICMARSGQISEFSFRHLSQTSTSSQILLDRATANI